MNRTDLDKRLRESLFQENEKAAQNILNRFYCYKRHFLISRLDFFFALVE